MASAKIPVDLTNPGQVFACLGFMEAAEILCGPCVGGFDYEGPETDTTFTLTAEGAADPVVETLGFLARAEVTALAPKDSGLSTTKWNVETITPPDPEDPAFFPCEAPHSPAALPILLSDGRAEIMLSHWADGPDTGRDNVKFWAGAAGYPGAALARDALAIVRGLGDNAIGDAAGDPFALSAPQSSSFRFDWRRDYIPLDAGFTLNAHGDIGATGYPLVELLAAVGLQDARPQRPEARNKLAYRYGVSSAVLPTSLARAVLGTGNIGFPMRVFRMRLGWPGQEGQARCIIDAQEEFAK
jgi:CRISPR-associated protein Csx14